MDSQQEETERADGLFYEIDPEKEKQKEKQKERKNTPSVATAGKKKKKSSSLSSSSKPKHRNDRDVIDLDKEEEKGEQANIFIEDSDDNDDDVELISVSSASASNSHTSSGSSSNSSRRRKHKSKEEKKKRRSEGKSKHQQIIDVFENPGEKNDPMDMDLDSPPLLLSRSYHRNKWDHSQIATDESDEQLLRSVLLSSSNDPEDSSISSGRKRRNHQPPPLKCENGQGEVEDEGEDDNDDVSNRRPNIVVSQRNNHDGSSNNNNGNTNVNNTSSSNVGYHSLFDEDFYTGDDDDNEDDNNYEEQLEKLLRNQEEDVSNALGDEEYILALHQFEVNFEAKYGATHPEFFKGSFTDIRKIARSTGKFVFIYLHSSTSPESDRFVTDVLCSSIVMGVLETNFLVYAWDITPLKHIATLKKQLSKHLSGDMRIFLPSEYPFVSIVSFLRGEFNLLHAQPGYIPLEALVEQLFNSIDLYSHQLEVEKTTLQRQESEREVRQNLLKEQEAEYMRTLKEDQLNEERKRQEEEIARIEAEQKHSMELEKQDRVRKLKENFPAEPEDFKENMTTILFRLPDGSRLTRKFRASDQLQMLFDFSTISGFPQEDGYILQTNFPKKVISDLDPTLTFQQAELVPQQTLFVQLE